MDASEFTIDCTGDAVVGDLILFAEAVWPAYKPKGRFGSRKNPEPLGHRQIVAEIIRDSYGAAKQQHTLTLRVLACEGYQPIETGTTIKRKGRNVYRSGTQRKPWLDENARRDALDEKHCRGSVARAEREARRETEGYYDQ